MPVEAHVDHGQALQRGADGVVPARDRQMQLVPAHVGARREVGVGEHQRVAAARPVGADRVAVGAHPARAVERRAQGPGVEPRAGRRGARPGRGGGDQSAEQRLARGALAELVEAAVELAHGDRPDPGLPAAARVGETGTAGPAQVGVVAGDEAAHVRAHVGAGPVRIALPRQPLDHAGGVDAGEEEVGLEVVGLPAEVAVARVRPEVARSLRVDRGHDVGEATDLVARVGVAGAEAQRPVVARLDVRHAAGGAADLGRVAAVGGRRGGTGGDDGCGQYRRGERSPHGAESLR